MGKSANLREIRGGEDLSELANDNQRAERVLWRAKANRSLAPLPARVRFGTHPARSVTVGHLRENNPRKAPLALLLP
jgi:hypothetical protein